MTMNEARCITQLGRSGKATRKVSTQGLPYGTEHSNETKATWYTVHAPLRALYTSANAKMADSR